MNQTTFFGVALIDYKRHPEESGLVHETKTVHKQMSIFNLETFVYNFLSFKMFLLVILVINIKTHDSESRGQEEAGRTRRMSVLFTGSTAVKLVNALNKPP